MINPFINVLTAVTGWGTLLVRVQGWEKFFIDIPVKWKGGRGKQQEKMLDVLTKCMAVGQDALRATRFDMFERT